MAGVAAELFRYHTWANQRLIDFCAALSADQLAAGSPTAYGTIRDTLAHLVGAEGSFTFALTGRWVDPPLAPGAPVDLAELSRRAGRTGEALAAAAARTRASRQLRVRRRGAERRIPAAALLAQALYHAGEHRAQVVATLDRLGVRPPDLSGWAFGGDMSVDYAEGADRVR
jgi:uncharacterized damage-inducible protein DinB